jgi:hypothetical protein
MSVVLGLRGLIDHQLSKPTKRLLGILLTGAFGVPVALLTFSLAGYGASTVGINARTLQGVSWALAVVFFSLVAMLLLPHGKLARLISLAAILAIIILDCIGQKRLVDDWAFVWSQEREILAHSPTAKLKELPPGSRVLYIGPSYYHGMVIFGANWDITGALYSLPALSRNRRRLDEGTNWIHSAATEYNWRWDGQNLTQEEPGAWTKVFPTTRLFIWNYERREVVEAAAGYRLDAKN